MKTKREYPPVSDFVSRSTMAQQRLTNSIIQFGLFVLICLPSNATPPAAPDTWAYPNAVQVEVKEVEGVLGATETFYRTKDDPEQVQDHYLRCFAQTDWHLDQLRTNRIPDHVFSGTMSGESAEPRQFMNVSILRDGSTETGIWLTYVPDLAAAREAHLKLENAADPSPKTESTPPTSAEKSLPSLDHISDLVNQRDATRLGEMGSDEFRRLHPISILLEQLETIRIKKTRPLFTATTDGEVCVSVFSYDLEQDARSRSRVGMMFWTLQDSQWRFHNLPLIEPGDLLPTKVVNALRAATTAGQ